MGCCTIIFIIVEKMCIIVGINHQFALPNSEQQAQFDAVPFIGNAYVLCACYKKIDFLCQMESIIFSAVSLFHSFNIIPLCLFSQFLFPPK